MKTPFAISALLLLCVSISRAEIIPASFDLEAIRDPGTLEIEVLQDWKPAAKVKDVRQKLIEITVCEWWPGQKVRLPVTLCAPDSGKGPCENMIVANMGLAPKAALPTGALLKLLVERKVGVVLVGMGTIDAMEPAGKLHLGMQEHLLKTKDARYTPAWIWGMSDMRALTAAITEKEVFRPVKVLATGGSKRGVGAAICGIHDERFTAILPVVAPMLGNPGGAYVRGSALHEEVAANEAFLAQLPPGPNPLGLPDTAREALLEREQRRIDQAITRERAVEAGWTKDEMLAMNDAAWDACRIASHLDRVRARGLEFFYHVGTNDNVCPALRSLGEKHPDFPLYILPGGQHGGPRTSGFTLQTPSRPEADENLHAFACHHFFGDRGLPSAPELSLVSEGGGAALKISVTLKEGVRPAANVVSWCIDRSPPYTFATEYDHWESAPLTETSPGVFMAEVPVPAGAGAVDLVSTHTHVENGVPFHFSSAYHRWERP